MSFLPDEFKRVELKRVETARTERRGMQIFLWSEVSGQKTESSDVTRVSWSGPKETNEKRPSRNQWNDSTFGAFKQAQSNLGNT